MDKIITILNNEVGTGYFAREVETDEGVKYCAIDGGGEVTINDNFGEYWYYSYINESTEETPISSCDLVYQVNVLEVNLVVVTSKSYEYIRQQLGIKNVTIMDSIRIPEEVYKEQTKVDCMSVVNAYSFKLLVKELVINCEEVCCE